MKKSQKRSVLSTLKTPKVAVFLLFAIGFGAFGIYKLASSSAATPVNISYRNYLNVSGMSSGTTTVNDLVAPYSSEIVGSMPSPKYVIQIAPGGTLVTDPPRSTFPNMVRICYVMRAAGAGTGSPSVVEIVGYSSSKRVSVSPEAYREYCISDAKGPGRDYNVKHISGGAVNVLHAAWYTNPVTN